MNHSVTRELLFAYFEGRATAFQKQLIDQWFRQEDHHEFFYECLTEWERRNLQFPVNVELAIERQRARIAKSSHPASDQTLTVEPSQPHPQLTSSGYRPKYWWLVAASVTLVFLVGAYFGRDTILFQTYQTGFEQVKEIRLPDGSLVSLNSNSTLRIPRFGFNDHDRKVYLTGEASFSVTHAVNHQKFIVKTLQGLDVVVLGTEFNVYTRERGTRVVLNRGKVQLNYQEGSTEKKLLMTPGDLVTLDTNGRASLLKTAEPQNFSAWKEHRFVFEETTLLEITRIFKENFGLRVEVADPELAQWSVSGSFTAHNAYELLDIITEASGLSYRKDGNRITIRQRE
jgi:transmembrane sensor